MLGILGNSFEHFGNKGQYHIFIDTVLCRAELSNWDFAVLGTGILRNTLAVVGTVDIHLAAAITPRLTLDASFKSVLPQADYRWAATRVSSYQFGQSEYENLSMLFLNRDIPPARRGEFRTYSDEELKRLNAAIVEMDEQTARIMIIHQMLGTRISDTLTLETDCLYEKEENIIIRIRQMKSSTYEKPISAELAQLIRMAITYTREKYGKTKYIFVNDKDPAKALQYGTIQSRIVKMIHEKDIRDDNGNLFGFGSHLYRHYYSVKLSEMHLDDWTIAQLLGHRSVRNVKYYRKMSNQALADDTREVLKMLSDQMKESLDGWEEEYEQIRQNGGM